VSFLHCDSVLDVSSLAWSSGALRPRSVPNELGSRPRLRAPTINGFTRLRFSEPNAAYRLLQHTTTQEHTREVRSSPVSEAFRHLPVARFAERFCFLLNVPPRSPILRRGSLWGANHRDVYAPVLTVRTDRLGEPRDLEPKGPLIRGRPSSKSSRAPFLSSTRGHGVLDCPRRIRIDRRPLMSNRRSRAG